MTPTNIVVIRSFILLVFLFSLVPTACNQKAFTETSGNVNGVFVEGQVADIESKFIGKATESNWKVEIVVPKIKVLNDIFFVDDIHGWLVGAFNTIYRTTDGGKEWKKIDIDIPEKTYISRIFFANENDGWIIAVRENISILERGQNHFWIYKTSDGGGTWKLQNDIGQAVVTEFRFRNPSEGYVTGYKYTETDSIPMKAAQALLLKTENGGNDWTDISKEFNALKAVEDRKSATQYMNDSVDHILFFDPTRIRMITSSSRVLETNDAGNTWSKISQYTRDDQQVGIKGFGYKDDGTEWLMESAYSIEGIRTRLKTRDSQGRLRRQLIVGVCLGSAYYLSESTFIAAGRAGDLMRDHDKAIIWETKDDGQTWSEIYSDPKNGGIGSMRQVNENSFWALCENGSVLHLFRPNI